MFDQIYESVKEETVYLLLENGKKMLASSILVFFLLT